MKKCKKCGAPLEGFLYNTIGKLLGLKPSEKDPEICNKCEADTEVKAEEVVTKVEAPAAPMTPETPAVPSSSAEATEDKEEKDDLVS
jgi:hypothetical protein